MNQQVRTKIKRFLCVSAVIGCGGWGVGVQVRVQFCVLHVVRASGSKGRGVCFVVCASAGGLSVLGSMSQHGSGGLCAQY